jgi:hypothetical protein
VGELDIDSHSLAAFKEEDRKLVEYCADLVGEPSGKTTSPGRSSLTSFNSLKVQGVSAAALFRPS